jgi:hypothetical protein
MIEYVQNVTRLRRLHRTKPATARWNADTPGNNRL